MSREMEQLANMSEMTPEMISATVNEAVKQITENPARMSSIMESVKGNDIILGHVAKYIDQHPELKNRALSSVSGNSKIKGEVNKMSLKEKRQLVLQMKKAKRSVGDSNEKVKALMINQSRQLKATSISADFPEGTSYAETGFHNLGGGISLTFQSSGAKNKRASKLAGFPVFGDAIVIRESEEDGKLIDLTITEFERRFPS